MKNCKIDDCQKRLLVAYLEGMIRIVTESWVMRDLAPDSEFEAVKEAEDYIKELK